MGWTAPWSTSILREIAVSMSGVDDVLGQVLGDLRWGRSAGLPGNVVAPVPWAS